MKLLLSAFIVASAMLHGLAASISYFPPLHGVIYPAAHVYSSHSSSLLTPTQRQYHTQDQFGQYAYGYSEPLSAKQESRSIDGTTRGSYSYRDAEGKIQMVAYTADNDGFHVAATNLPRAVPAIQAQHDQQLQQQQQQTSAAATTSDSILSDPVDFASARSAHLAANEETKLRLAASQSATINNVSAGSHTGASGNGRSVELPYPVEDTPAVALAKAEHLKRFEHEKLRNEVIAASSGPSSIRSIIPAVYAYGYPVNTHVLASGYVF